MNNLEKTCQIKKYLHQQGYKLTTQREILINILIEHEKEYLSAEQLFLLTKNNEQNKAIGLATVYRTLEVLHDMDILAKMMSDEGLAKYSLQKLSLKHPTHRLICQKCGSFFEIEDDILFDIADLFQKEYGFQLKEQQITFQGLCQRCRDK